MEAIAVQINQEVEKPVANKKNFEDKKSEAKVKSGNDKFLSFLQDLTLSLEQQKKLPEKITSLKSTKPDTNKKDVKNLNHNKKLSTIKDLNLSSKNKKSTDLEVKVDEEIIPEKILGQLLDLEDTDVEFLKSDIFLMSKNGEVLDDTINEKTLLQKLLQLSQSSSIDEKKLRELIERFEKAALKSETKGAKNKQASTSVINQTKNVKSDTSKKKDSGDTFLKKVTVKDLRSVKTTKTLENMEFESEGVGTHGTNGERVETENATDTQIQISLNLLEKLTGEVPTKESHQTMANGQTESTSFSQVLSEEIYRSTDDIVQAGKIVLKDNEAGSIRLNLQPANLGKVKIFLELQEGKKLSGKITVNSKEALQAFEENLNALIASFEDNGFETAGFELAWSNPQETGQQFENGRTFFGSSKSYEDDFQVMVADNSAETMVDYGKVNVLV